MLGVPKWMRCCSRGIARYWVRRRRSLGEVPPTLAGGPEHGRLPVFLLLPHCRTGPVLHPRPAALPKCIAGLFTLYGLSFLSYTVFPAGGPHRFMAFETPLNGPWLLNWTLKPVNDGSNCMDVFPSVHFAATLYLLLFDGVIIDGGFGVAPAVPDALVFHDVFAFPLLRGFGVGRGCRVAGWFVAQRYARSAQEQAIRAEEAAIRPQPRRRW